MGGCVLNAPAPAAADIAGLCPGAGGDICPGKTVRKAPYDIGMFELRIERPDGWWQQWHATEDAAASAPKAVTDSR